VNIVLFLPPFRIGAEYYVGPEPSVRVVGLRIGMHQSVVCVVHQVTTLNVDVSDNQSIPKPGLRIPVARVDCYEQDEEVFTCFKLKPVHIGFENTDFFKSLVQAPVVSVCFLITQAIFI